MHYRVQRARGLSLWYLVTTNDRRSYAQCFDTFAEALAAAVEYADRDRQTAMELAA